MCVRTSCSSSSARPCVKTKYSCTAAKYKGASEDATTGLNRLFPAINVNDCATTFMFGEALDYSHSRPGDITRATVVIIGD